MQGTLCSQHIVYGPSSWKGCTFFVASLPLNLSRDQAREWTRTLVKEFLSNQHDLSPECIIIDNRRAHAPQMICDGQVVFVSFSYTETHVGVAFSGDWRVGIDIEDASRVLGRETCIATAELYFSIRDADEVRECAFGDCDRLFLHKWVIYEATYKCLGLAIREWEVAQDSLFNECEQTSFTFLDVVGAIAVRKFDAYK